MTNDKKELIRNINDFTAKLYTIADRDTAYPQTQADWNENNRFCGHCAIVVAMIYEKFGGKIMRGVLQNYGYSHYWNEVDGLKIDATKTQFSGDEPIVDISEVGIDRILGNEETKKRYLLLKDRFKNAFENQNQLQQ